MVSRSRRLAAVMALLLILAGVLAALLVRSDRVGTGVTTSLPAAAVTSNSPYDFSEAASDSPDFARFAQAKFVSLTLFRDGDYQSYLVSRDNAGFAPLIAALGAAGEVQAPETATSTTGEDLRPTLTVVMPDRTTFTFFVDEGLSLLIRGDRAWKTRDALTGVLDQAIK